MLENIKRHKKKRFPYPYPLPLPLPPTPYPLPPYPVSRSSCLNLDILTPSPGILPSNVKNSQHINIRSIRRIRGVLLNNKTLRLTKDDNYYNIIILFVLICYAINWSIKIVYTQILINCIIVIFTICCIYSWKYPLFLSIAGRP